jgi:hypothetical protein
MHDHHMLLLLLLLLLLLGSTACPHSAGYSPERRKSSQQ